MSTYCMQLIVHLLVCSEYAFLIQLNRQTTLFHSVCLAQAKLHPSVTFAALAL